MKLLYITNGAGGLERVLSIKASYLADKLMSDKNIKQKNNWLSCGIIGCEEMVN